MLFYENSQFKAAIDTNTYSTMHTHETPLIPKIYHPFDPPTLGITFLGTSHGFDPLANTTGFIIWINGHGVLVDPPTSTTRYLEV